MKIFSNYFLIIPYVYVYGTLLLDFIAILKASSHHVSVPFFCFIEQLLKQYFFNKNLYAVLCNIASYSVLFCSVTTFKKHLCNRKLGLSEN